MARSKGRAAAYKAASCCFVKIRLTAAEGRGDCSGPEGGHRHGGAGAPPLR